MLVLISCLVMYTLLAKGTVSKFLPQSAYFQFMINPSTIFIVGGLLVAKYGDRPVAKTGMMTDGRLLTNYSMPKSMTAGRYLGRVEEHVGAQNQSYSELYNTVDPMTALEIRLIGFIIQSYDNSTEWTIKFVDLSPKFAKFQQQQQHRKANVLITDAEERQPIWVVVNLSAAKVDRWMRGRKGAIGKLSDEEGELAGQAALTDGEVQDRIKGVENKDVAGIEVVPDVWDAGFIAGSPKLVKLVQVYFFAVRQQSPEELFAYPCNFVAYVQLDGGANTTVRDLENLPLYQYTDDVDPKSPKSPVSSYSNFFPGTIILPNTIRRNQHRFKAPSQHNPLANGERSSSLAGFSISGLAELQR